MGKTFDNFVRYVKKNRKYRSTEHQSKLETIIRNTAVFDLVTTISEFAKVLDENNHSEQDYYDIAKQNGKKFILPYDTTAIELTDVVLICNKIDEDTFDVISYSHSNNHNGEMLSLYTFNATGSANGILEGHQIRNSLFQEIQDYDSRKPRILDHDPMEIVRELKKNDPTNPVFMNEEFLNSINSSTDRKKEDDYFQRLMFTCISGIMNPKVFIIGKSSPQCKKYEIRNKGRTEPLRKTIMRRHYQICTPEEIKDLASGNVERINRVVHPVIGHVRILTSSYYKNKEKTLVKQHYRGEGTIEHLNGWKYDIILKDEHLRLVDLANKTQEETYRGRK